MNTRTRLVASAAIALAAGALAVACGSSSNTPPATTSNAGGEGFAAYTACLQRNGVTLPSRAAGNGTAGPGGFRGGERPSGSPRPSFSPGSRGGFGGGGGGGGFEGGGGFFGTEAPAGVDQATWTKATQACASVRPTAGPSRSPRQNTALLAYRNCLADHGVAMGNGPLNTADPKYAAAEQACAALRPSARPRPTGTPTP